MQFPSSPKAEDLKVEAMEMDGQASLLVESLLVEGKKGVEGEKGVAGEKGVEGVEGVEGEKRVEGEKGVEVSSPACESLTQFKTCR